MKYKVCKFLIIYYTRISIEMKCHTLPILQSKYFYVASVRFDGSVPEAFLLKEVVARMQPSTLHAVAFLIRRPELAFLHSLHPVLAFMANACRHIICLHIKDLAFLDPLNAAPKCNPNVRGVEVP